MRGIARSQTEHCTGHQKAAQSSTVDCGHQWSCLLYHHAAGTHQQHPHGSVRSRCISASRWSASHLPTFSHAISAILSVLQCANECTHHLASELSRYVNHTKPHIYFIQKTIHQCCTRHRRTTTHNTSNHSHQMPGRRTITTTVTST
nr:uncharacterized protein LOC108120381 isoform X6 [Drosophila bipectinata]